MQTPSLSSKFHIDNRAALAKSIGDDAIAIIDTADVLTRAGDYEYPFRPDSNFFYLTGIAEPEAVLVLIPGASNPDMRELLFISGTSEFVGTWEGERLTEAAAREISGVKAVFQADEFDAVMERVLQRHRTVYLSLEESLRPFMPSPAKRRARRLRENMPLHELRSALPRLARQRMIKHPDEIAQLRRAIDITGAGLEAVYRRLGSAKFEYHLDAELTAEFLRHGTDHAFRPIIAAGTSATIIHHMKNNGPVAPPDAVLFDVGAEWNFYSADISRTVPVSGHFSDRQRAVYAAVRRVQQAAIAMLKPGVKRLEYERDVRELILEELKKLGLKNPDIHTYYPHATSHFLGLDVHDVGDYSAPLEAGMVLTVEPGIYLKEEGIGVRLEDDILITKDGCEVLSEDIPYAGTGE